MSELPSMDFVEMHHAADVLQKLIHQKMAHWWKNPETGEDVRDNPLVFPTKLMLTVTELAEACEGDRKELMDDHLPHRPMREVELADTIIRLFDLGGAYGMDLGGAIAEKMAYNLKRADHKNENRVKKGGKKY